MERRLQRLDALAGAADADVRLAGGKHGELAVAEIEARELLSREDARHPAERIAATVRTGQRETAQRLGREADQRLFGPLPRGARALLPGGVELRLELLAREPSMRGEVQEARPRGGREQGRLGARAACERLHLALERLRIQGHDRLHFRRRARQESEARPRAARALERALEGRRARI